MGIVEEPPAGEGRWGSDPHAALHGTAAVGQLSRRTVLRAAALAGAGAPLLAACGSGSSEATTPDSTTSAGGEAGTPKSDHATSPGGSGASSSALATTGEIPKGGGLILADDGVVITQPSAGTFKGFSSTCTHAGCPLDNVSNGTINCICHGSQFSITDGSVVTGPATVPLPPKPLSVHGTDISLK